MAAVADRFKKLPKPIRLVDTIAQVDTRSVSDPDGGRNPDTDFVLRYALA